MPTGPRRLIWRVRSVSPLAAMAVIAAVAAVPVWGQGLPDLIFADGFEDNCADNPLVGTPCDGPDSDLCVEGTVICVGSVLECSDDTDSTVDVCNSVDDDCDPASADGSEDPITGSACDGTDSDLCAEGTLICIGSGFVCSDNTGSTVDLCNGVDDDCDVASADGAEDPLIGTACDGSDLDACNEGTLACSGGAPVCSDSTGDSNRVLDGGFEAGSGGNWTEFSTNFGSPICTVAECSTGGGTGPRSGAYWVWLGGIDADETAFVNQSFVIAVGTARLTFWLEIPTCDTAGTDTFTVWMDGAIVFSTTNADPACGVIGYVKKSIDVTAFANGASHTLEFRGVFSAFGLVVTSVMVDDVRLEACP